jgi:hypothetical protein
MPTANQRAARNVVMVLFAIGLVVAGAGYHHQKAQRDAQVTWQDVSATLQEVEIAKRELFESMHEKTGKL